MTRDPLSAPERLIARLLVLYVGIRIALLAWSSWSVRFVMDELALLQQIVYFDKLYEGVDPIKTVLAIYFFNSPRHFTDDATSLMLASRSLGLCAALGMALAVAHASRVIAGRWLGGLVGVATLLSFTNFAERAFRIRTDTGQSLCAALALVAVLTCQRPNRAAWLAGLACGASFLCTQKAVYVAIAFGLGFLLAEDPRHGGWRRTLGRVARFSLAWGSTLVVYSVSLGGSRFWSVFTSIVLGPTRFALNALEDYEGLERYAATSLRQNALLYLLVASAVTWAIFNWRTQVLGIRVAAVATAVLTLLTFLHYQPWPYVFVLPQIFLAPWAAVLVAPGLPLSRGGRGIAALAFAASLAMAIPRAVVYPAVHTNEDQLRAVHRLESLLSPSDQYFDGLGMVPTRTQAGGAYNWWWDRPALRKLARDLRAGDRSVIETILADHPKVWVLNYRTLAILPLVTPSLMHSYVRAMPDVLVSGIEMAPGERERRFLCVWPGRYRLFSRDGGPVGDDISTEGGEAAVEIDLAAGWHLLRRSNAESAAVLMPASLRLERPMPSAEEPVPDFFLDVYDF